MRDLFLTTRRNKPFDMAEIYNYDFRGLRTVRKHITLTLSEEEYRLAIKISPEGNLRIWSRDRCEGLPLFETLCVVWHDKTVQSYIAAYMQDHNCFYRRKIANDSDLGMPSYLTKDDSDADNIISAFYADNDGYLVYRRMLLSGKVSAWDVECWEKGYKPIAYTFSDMHIAEFIGLVFYIELRFGVDIRHYKLPRKVVHYVKPVKIF